MKRNLITILLLFCLGAAHGPLLSLASAQGSSTAMDYFREGGAYWLQNEFKKAIPPYEKAFEMQKAHRTMDKKVWRALINNLGTCYGITARETGNYKKAKETFEYGIANDPEYPFFYYNLACTYAEMGNLDKTIEYLKVAFEKKGNLDRGEKMPTPATDSSFQRFIGDDKFIKVLQELGSK